MHLWHCLMESVVALIDSVPSPPSPAAGQIPEWVSGKLYRLGPGKWDLGGGFSLRHWFDGAAILSAYDVHKGKVRRSGAGVTGMRFQRDRRRFPCSFRGPTEQTVKQWPPNFTTNTKLETFAF